AVLARDAGDSGLLSAARGDEREMAGPLDEPVIRPSREKTLDDGRAVIDDGVLARHPELNRNRDARKPFRCEGIADGGRRDDGSPDARVVMPRGRRGPRSVGEVEPVLPQVRAVPCVGPGQTMRLAA